MTKEELKKAVELELQWLKYYGLAESRAILTLSQPIYDQLRSIGYTKRVIPLDQRCAFLRITSSKPITKETSVQDLQIANSPRNHDQNIYTALEFWLLKYPEDNKWVLENLQ